MAILAVITATCSSAATGAPSSAATGTPIKFGLVSTDSGFSAGLGSEGQALQAYLNYWNAHGGFKGHPVEVINIDAGSIDPSMAEDAARQLVNNDQVVAMVSNYNLYDCMVNTPYYASIPIAVINTGAEASCYNPKVDFTTYAVSGTSGLGIVLKWSSGKGEKKTGIIAPSAGGVLTPLIDDIATYAKKIHVSFKIDQLPGYVLTSADLDTAFVQFKQAKVKTIMTFAQTSAYPLILQEGTRQGLTTSNTNYAFTLTYSPFDPAAAKPLDGTYVVLFSYSFEDHNAATEKAEKILRGHVAMINGNTTRGYDDGVLLQQVLNKVKGPITRASILATLKTMTNVVLPLDPVHANLADPLHNPEGGEILKVVNGKYVPVSPFLVIHP